MSRRTRLGALCSTLTLALASMAWPAAPGAAEAERGAYLATIGNCAGCHTAPGGADYAGGLRLPSDYGTFVTPNITPDDDTGIGGWSADDLHAAMHDGERPDGSPMYPACPYPSYTRLTRADIDALHAYLRTRPAVENPLPDHDLGFPWRYRSLLNVWQAFYFEPGPAPEPPAGASAAWQRGRYLVEGLGHCDACHRERSMLGGMNTAADAPGAVVHGWYAPSLSDPGQAGLQDWSLTDAARFMTHGKHGDAVMLGPMAGVVFESLQYLSDADARAMATYLVSLPRVDAGSPQRLIRLSGTGRDRAMALGRDLYADRCADCHGDRGQGSGAGDAGAPALAGNRGVTQYSPLNAARMIHEGGFAAATEGNPRPYGMPPFYDLSDRELAALLTYIRGSWGNDAPPVSTNNLRR